MLLMIDCFTSILFVPKYRLCYSVFLGSTKSIPLLCVFGIWKLVNVPNPVTMVIVELDYFHWC